MALNQGYNAQVVWDSDHVLQTNADITFDASRGRIDVTTHGDSSLPYRSFEVGLFDPIEITLPIFWDYTRAETEEMVTALHCGTNTKVEFEDSTDSANPFINGNAKVVKISPTGRMENAMQIVNVTFLFSGAPTEILGYNP